MKTQPINNTNLALVFFRGATDYLKIGS